MKRVPDVLVLGDSSGLHGFDPAVAEGLLGCDVKNLCTVGDALVANPAAMLAHIVREAGAPKRVFLVHVYDIWHRDPSGYVIAQVPLSLESVQQDFSFLTWNSELREQWWTDRYLPLVAENASLLELLKSTIRFDAGANRVGHVRASGFLPITEPNVPQVRQDVEEHRSFVRTNAPKISEANLAALRQILEIAQRNAIDLTLAFAPTAEELAKDPNFQRYYGGMKGLLEREIAGRPHVRIVPARLITFPSDEMENADHVVGPTAGTWTSAIVRESSAPLSETSKP